MKILSMDIGKKHTAIYREEIDVTSLTTEDAILSSGKILSWFLIDFTTLPGTIYQNVCHILNSQQEVLLDTDLVLIEQQMNINHEAQEIQHIIHTWFTLFAPHAECRIVPSTLKTKMFGFQSDNKRQRKNWAVEMVSKINNNNEYLASFKKKDDVADAFMQCKAYLKQIHLLKKKPRKTK